MEMVFLASAMAEHVYIYIFTTNEVGSYYVKLNDIVLNQKFWKSIFFFKIKLLRTKHNVLCAVSLNKNITVYHINKHLLFSTIFYKIIYIYEFQLQNYSITLCYGDHCNPTIS